MLERSVQRERAYRRRLLVLFPLATAIALIILLGSDLVPFKSIEQHLGWRGPLRVLPEITIVPDEDRFENFTDDRLLKAMTSVDLEAITDAGPAEGSRRRIKTEEKLTHETVVEKGQNLIRSHPVHTDIPYSEDYVIVRMVRPEYPPEELALGIEGEVMLEILVNTEGKVERAWVLSTVGPKSFEVASLKAVKEFLFEPPLREGRPTPVSIRFLVRFRIVN